MNPLVLILKLFVMLGGFAVVVAKLIGELVADLLNKHASKTAPPAAAAAIPAAPAGMLASSVIATPMTPLKPLPSLRSDEAAEQFATTADLSQHDLSDFKPVSFELAEHEPDELDWAGSLSHAGITALHLDNVLSMARAGWLTPAAEHQADVAAALAALEAFHNRTCTAIAPILDQMTDDQRAEFFGENGPDFPPQLPIEETS